ncbi:Hypothetical predicted protein [Scomber scombrus]|uniref:Uncharacterized protein n=1 Tax=Scomber scombrus TaxID=13677 RepID=A0AAV1NG43_SCOSC
MQAFGVKIVTLVVVMMLVSTSLGAPNRGIENPSSEEALPKPGLENPSNEEDLPKPELENPSIEELHSLLELRRPSMNNKPINFAITDFNSLFQILKILLDLFQ